MPNMLEPILRFSDVAFGIDTTPKALRNWLQRDQVDLFSDAPEGGGWRKFPLIDVALLAIVRHLVAFGFNVETASSVARTILITMQGEEWLQHEPDTFLMFWVNRGVEITPSGESGEDGDASSWHCEINWMNHARRESSASAFLTLAPGRIVNTALLRAVSGEDAPLDVLIEKVGYLRELLKERGSE